LVFLIFLRSSHLRSSFNINFSVLPKTNTLLNWAFPFLLAQIILGVWLSSNYAALACPDFPTCHGKWLPPADYAKGFNFFQQIGPDYLGGQMDVESRIAIHFIHRLGAIAVSIVFLLLSWRFFKENYPLTSLGFASLITFQIVLGISNIYFQVPLYIAIAHNLGALFLMMYLSFVRLKSSTISPA
jgi:cytochrome c oxidase assembly protein subunit 15